MEYGLRYLRDDGVKLQGYTYSDWESNALHRKSTSRCCFSLGSAMISWINKKKTSVALSSTKTEYMAASMASCEALWLRKMLTRLFDKKLRPTMIHCNNQSCIKLSRIQYLMTSRSILRSDIISSERIQKGAVKSSNTFPWMSRLKTLSLRPY